MQVEYLFDGGMPCDVEAVDGRTLRCTPYACESGSQWFYFCVKIHDILPAGRVELHWPRRLTRADLPADASEEYINRQTGHDSFARVLPRTCAVSSDMSAWESPPGVHVDEDDVVTIDLPAGPGPVYLATQQPYRWSDLEALLAYVGELAPAALQPIGQSRAGRGIHAVCLDPLDRATNPPRRC